MAKMHTRKKGRSGSRNTFYGMKHNWIQMSQIELEEAVVQMRKEGLTASMIGIRLRDLYGVPKLKYVNKKKIGDVLAENKIAPEVPEDLMGLISKYKKVSKHINLNRNDLNNDRRKSLIMAKMLRLVRYYKRTGRLSKGWELNKVL
ncbi:MAG: 30S ribosomal protein S15 [Candidatus Thermoplasmatota archaeon]|jgi:small subunit ribosomal protein S15|nr:30S ribosomal protein S15 [Candidatus Thermoplasmatota archaeon]MCL5988184.1 30S ribosomal protein S15 [Candidatus Thermoplasmatota archaeon]